MKVLNISDTGFLLSTSLANKTLLPGMKIKNCSLVAPCGTANGGLDLQIENTRPADEDSFVLGVSIQKKDKRHSNILKSYLSMFSKANSGGSRIATLFSGKFLSKKLKQALTYRIATTATEYEDILKLRYLGYRHHGKVKETSTWREQGDGLENEGNLVCAYLGGELVASMEFRFLEQGKQLRSGNFFK